MMFMVSPSLISVSFDHCSIDDVTAYLSVAVINRNAPALQSLTIASSENGDAHFLPSIAQAKYLRDLTLILSGCSEPDTFDLRYLRHLEHLEVLTIDLRGALVADSMIPVQNIGHYSKPRSLKRLALFLDHLNVSLASILLELYQDSPVVYFCLMGFFEVEHCQRIFASIPSLWYKSLTTVELEGDKTFVAADPYQLQPFSNFIVSLYHLHGLETVVIGGIEDTFYMTDGDIWNFCHAWPNLVNLQVKAAKVEGRLPTVASLPIFVRFCPNLRILEIPLDVINVPLVSSLKVLSDPDGRHSKLELLTLLVKQEDLVRCSVEDVVGRLAYHFKKAFPCLFMVEVKVDGSQYDAASPWEEVNATMALCQEAQDSGGILEYKFEQSTIDSEMCIYTGSS
jgi:hypothetical protein